MANRLMQFFEYAHLPEHLRKALTESRTAETGPTAVVVEIEPQNASGIPFLLMDPVGIKFAFQGFLEEEK